MSQFVRYKVVGALPIRDAATKESVKPGGVVQLDPEKTNVAALIEGGSIEPADTKSAKG